MTKQFRFGIINEQMKAPAAWLEHVRRAEALGYATFLLRDHFVSDFFGDQYAPLVALTAAAAVTTRLRVGTLVLDNDYRHPVMLAKEAATLDQLSGGRLELGIGAGWLRSEYDQAGMTFDPNGVRVSRLAEALKVIKGLFRDEPLTFEGEYYTIRGIQNVPAVCQRPHPPLLIGAGQKRMLQLAGQEADIVGLLTTSVASGTMTDDPTDRLPEKVMQKLAWIQEGAGGRYQEIELSLIPSFTITDDRQDAAERLIQERGWQGISVEQVLAMPSMVIGTLDEIAHELIVRRDQYGFSYYVIGDDEMEMLAPLVARLRNV